MSIPTFCIDCDTEIQPSTAAKAHGRCMPCNARQRTRLSPDQDAIFEAALARFVHAGWDGDFVNKRGWLDFCARLRRHVRRSPDRLWEALSVCEVDVTATKEPAFDVALAIGRLRVSAGGLFPAEYVNERCDGLRDLVTFTLSGISYEVPVTPTGRSNAFSVLAIANGALAENAGTHRFHSLARKRGRLLIAFARPETIERSLRHGLCPSAT